MHLVSFGVGVPYPKFIESWCVRTEGEGGIEYWIFWLCGQTVMIGCVKCGQGRGRRFADVPYMDGPLSFSLHAQYQARSKQIPSQYCDEQGELSWWFSLTIMSMPFSDSWSVQNAHHGQGLPCTRFVRYWQAVLSLSRHHRHIIAKEVHVMCF